MPSLRNNGVLLPIGTGTNSGDTDEEDDLIPDDGMQWTDEDWRNYQDANYENDVNYTAEEIARWEQDRRERHRARTQRQLSMPKCGMRGHTIRFCTKEGGGLVHSGA